MALPSAFCEQLVLATLLGPTTPGLSTYGRTSRASLPFKCFSDAPWANLTSSAYPCWISCRENFVWVAAAWLEIISPGKIKEKWKPVKWHSTQAQWHREARIESFEEYNMYICKSIYIMFTVEKNKVLHSTIGSSQHTVYVFVGCWVLLISTSLRTPLPQQIAKRQKHFHLKNCVIIFQFKC